MARAISLLHLEGSPAAARRLADSLKAESLEARVITARDQPAFEAALHAGGPDVAVCSFNAACRSAAATVRRTRRAAPDVPVIAVLNGYLLWQTFAG